MKHNINLPRPRIYSLDGLRAIAALGVLWIHSWTIVENPRLYIFGFDLSSILALGGNGVDLFFVISGFCMYYFYNVKCNFKEKMKLFVYKRWLRLSPAFYVYTIVYMVWDYSSESFAFLFSMFLTSAFYLNSILPQFNATIPFWTLSVEWQFYLIIPLILYYQEKIGLKKILMLICTISIFISIISVIVFREMSDIITFQIPFRIIQFILGILTARLIMSSYQIRYRLLYCFLSIIVMFTGRLLLSSQIILLSESYYNIFKLLGYSLIGLAFSGILYLSLTSDGLLKFFLETRILRFIGKISYSFYLIHGLILSIVFLAMKSYLINFDSFASAILIFITSLITIIPISYISYNFLEKPFISKNK